MRRVDWVQFKGSPSLPGRQGRLELVSFVKMVIQGLVEQPEYVQVYKAEGSRNILLEVSVHPEDAGFANGRHGAHADALRDILKMYFAQAESKHIHCNLYAWQEVPEEMPSPGEFALPYTWILEEIVTVLVKKPEAIRIIERVQGRDRDVDVIVDPSDYRRLIGSSGVLAIATRDLVVAAAKCQGIGNCYIECVRPERIQADGTLGPRPDHVYSSVQSRPKPDSSQDVDPQMQQIRGAGYSAVQGFRPPEEIIRRPKHDETKAPPASPRVSSGNGSRRVSRTTPDPDALFPTLGGGVRRARRRYIDPTKLN